MLTLFILGLCLGSFVNALVWRLRQQELAKTSRKSIKSKVHTVGNNKVNLSITTGRSICVHCGHELTAKDLIPVLSWLWLRGRCRYCHKAIGWQYPVVELLTAGLFLASYAFWPLEWDVAGIINFAVWLVMLVGFVALAVYDLRWMLLPNRLVYPMIVLAAALAVLNIWSASLSVTLFDTIFSVAIAGGLFYGLFLVSSGRWIGGGDVKLGFLIGLLLQDPSKAFLVLLTASLLGTLVIIPGMLLKKVTPKSRIPFGPFLITAAIFVQLFGTGIIAWYERSLLLTA